MLAEIPDLRLPGASWIDPADDLNAARELLRVSTGWSVEATVRRVYARRTGWTGERVAMRTRQVLDDLDRRREDLRTWLRPAMAGKGRFLDLGCGPGTLLAAAAREGFRGIGIDVSMEWLVVARKMVRESGGEPQLAAAFGERLPLGEASVGGVISLDVIEHVGDPGRYLEQIHRVLQPGGRAILTTPNRYSLTAEPHVQVWGVGWVPRRWQEPFVRWCSGKDYRSTALLSRWELSRLIRRRTDLRASITPGAISPFEIRRFRRPKALLAGAYNTLLRFPPFRLCWQIVGPYFVAVGEKPASPAAGGPPRRNSTPPGSSRTSS